MFTRRTATVTMSAPDASCARAMTGCDGYLPVPMISRDWNVRPAITNGESVIQKIPNLKSAHSINHEGHEQHEGLMNPLAPFAIFVLFVVQVILTSSIIVHR